MKVAFDRVEAGFELLEKLGVPFFCFHDRDVAPEGATLRESNARLDRVLERVERAMAQTGRRLLWGTANLFGHPRYAAGAATNPDPEAFAYVAAQAKHCLEAPHRLGGANYVLWGGCEGYETLLNTDPRREIDQLGRFLTLVAEHKHRIGFPGALLLEPKPLEPTKHQYDLDAAAGVQLTFRIPADRVAFTGPDLVRIVEPGRIEVQIGASSADIRLHASCTVAGPTRRVGEDRALLAGVTVEPE